MPPWSSARERGWVVATRAGVLQAVGAHITGLIKTEPIAEIQERAGENGLSSVRPAYLSACIAKSGLLFKIESKN